MLTSKSSAVQRAEQVFRVEVQRRQPKIIDSLAWDVVDLFFLRGSLTAADVQHIGRELLADPVTETFTVAAPNDTELTAGYAHTIDVTLLPGVTDSVAESLMRAARLLGITALEAVATGHSYRTRAALSAEGLHRLAVERFANPVIQRYEVDQPITPPFVPYQQADDRMEVIPVRNADDARLLLISAERRLALDLAEMQAVRAYFTQEGRDPTDAELEMIAQTWSEHCSHKTFRAVIDYTGPLPGAPADSAPVAQRIDGLLKTYIRAATDKINKPWVRSAFVDNAGIIAFDDHYDLAFKVETHNHPSALEPFGGANTGVGGVVRDILGVSARPIANTDVLCFGPLDLPESELPAGVLPPRRIAEGVIHGVEDYGNKMGIPTVNGAVFYHRGYTANPLVFCGCLGILPHGANPTEPLPGDLIIVIGGRTGRDGLRGATFSSMEMDQTTSQVAGSAVQIGHPIHEKQTQEVILRARDEKLYHAITDCGAGGLSSAVGEMAQVLGARVRLESVPLKYPGLRPWEIWLSEAQERMVLAVPPQNWPRLQAICAGQEIEAVHIGEFAADGRLHLVYGERPVSDLSMAFLHEGMPRRHLKAVWLPPAAARPEPPSPDVATRLLELLADPNTRSKEDVIRRYDHEVQGGTVIKPLAGARGIGHGDGAVLVPLETAHDDPDRPVRGLALGAGMCPPYGESDPYLMAWAAVDEALRNVVAVGADPDQVAILDNFCWGSATLPERLGSLVRCVQGCHDAAVAYGVPFVSGKDSLNNEYTGADGQKHAIPGTLVISAVGIVPDVRKSVSTALNAPHDLYVIGEVAPRDMPPLPVPDTLERMRRLHRAIAAGWISACHDSAEGGIGVALAEMLIGGTCGAAITLSDAEALFAEALGTFVVAVLPEHRLEFKRLFEGMPCTRIGAAVDAETLSITLPDGAVTIKIDNLKAAWRGHLSPDTRYDRLPVSAAPAVPRPERRRSARTGPARVLILHATGTNRDHDAALACRLAGGEPEIVHVNQLLGGERRLLDYHMLIMPGGFSYGDDLGAGVLWALDVGHRLGTDLTRFIAEGRPVLGICNGFQALVKAGLLPGPDWRGTERPVTLTYNESARFECRWVVLRPAPHSPCLFTEGIESIFCPVAHGEGRLVARDDATLQALQADGLAALSYVGESYPLNPNGSAGGIAGLCNPAGNVLGLMPHPENHVFPWQSMAYGGDMHTSGLRLFQNGIKYA